MGVFAQTQVPHIANVSLFQPFQDTWPLYIGCFLSLYSLYKWCECHYFVYTFIIYSVIYHTVVEFLQEQILQTKHEEMFHIILSCFALKYLNSFSNYYRKKLKMMLVISICMFVWHASCYITEEVIYFAFYVSSLIKTSPHITSQPLQINVAIPSEVRLSTLPFFGCLLQQRLCVLVWTKHSLGQRYLIQQMALQAIGHLDGFTATHHDIRQFKCGSHTCCIQTKMYRLNWRMVIWLYNSYIFVWIQNVCLVNTIFYFDPSNGVIKRLWCISIFSSFSLTLMPRLNVPLKGTFPNL